jgi:hypothetical protein
VKVLFITIILACILSACDTIDQSEVSATLASGDSILATEAALSNATAVIQRNEIVATLSVNQTQIAYNRYVNNILGDVIESGNTPTPVLNVGAVPMPDYDHLYSPIDVAPFWPGVIAPTVEGYPTLPSNLYSASLSSGDVIFTGLTSMLDDDGCVLNPRTTFFADRDSLIFYTVRLVDVPAGTQFRIEWEFEGSVRVREGWNTPGYSADSCARLALSNTTTQFTPGNWMAYLYVGDTMVADPAMFVIRPE